MLNLNDINAIKIILSKHWKESCQISPQIQISIPLQKKNLTPPIKPKKFVNGVKNIFLKKKVDAYSLPFKKNPTKPIIIEEVEQKKDNNYNSFAVVSQPPVVISNKQKPKLAIEIAYSINSIQWNEQVKNDVHKTINNTKSVINNNSSIYGNSIILNNKSNLVLDPKFESIKNESAIPQSIVNEEDESIKENKTSLNAKKDNELKRLSNKLNHFKYQNNIIKDENKKLIEVINLFKMISTIEHSQSQISTIKQNNNNSEVNFNSLSLSTIKQRNLTPLNSTRDNIEKLTDNLLLKDKQTKTITGKSSINSRRRNNNYINKSNFHYRTTNGNNDYLQESSLEDLEERLNNEFLYNKYDIPLQINVPMLFEGKKLEKEKKETLSEKEEENENEKENNSNYNNNEIIPFHLMDKKKLYQNIVKSRISSSISCSNSEKKENRQKESPKYSKIYSQSQKYFINGD